MQLLPNLHGLEIDGAFESERYVATVKEQIRGLFGHHILKEAHRQIDLAASMPGAEEMALFDRIGIDVWDVIDAAKTVERIVAWARVRRPVKEATIVPTTAAALGLTLPTPSVPHDPSAPSKGTVLVIDDDPNACELMVRSLTKDFAVPGLRAGHAPGRSRRNLRQIQPGHTRRRRRTWAARRHHHGR